MFDDAQLTQIEAKLDLLLTKVGSLMVQESDLQADLDAIKTGVTALLAQVAALVAAGPGPVTQAQLDSLDAEAKGITAAMAPPTTT
jgi:hypothetical protein